MNLRHFIPFGIALLVLLASIGLYATGYFILSHARAEDAALAGQEATKNAEVARLTQAHTALASHDSDQAVLDQYVIKKSDIVPFLESLQSTGKSLGSAVDVLSVADQSDKAHNRIQLSLSISGSFDAVMRTIGTIEYGPYDGVITSLSLASTPGTGHAAPFWTASSLFSVGLRTASTTP